MWLWKCSRLFFLKTQLEEYYGCVYIIYDALIEPLWYYNTNKSVKDSNLSVRKTCQNIQGVIKMEENLANELKWHLNGIHIP